MWSYSLAVGDVGVWPESELPGHDVHGMANDRRRMNASTDQNPTDPCSR
jgi:hypothetical protein